MAHLHVITWDRYELPSFCTQFFLRGQSIWRAEKVLGFPEHSLSTAPWACQGRIRLSGLLWAAPMGIENDVWKRCTQQGRKSHMSSPISSQVEGGSRNNTHQDGRCCGRPSIPSPTTHTHHATSAPHTPFSQGAGRSWPMANRDFQNRTFPWQDQGCHCPSSDVTLQRCVFIHSLPFSVRPCSGFGCTHHCK